MLTLLPTNPDSLLVSRKEKLSSLSLLLKLTEEAIEALNCFLNKNYKDFDAQVGETSCQIRAYKICMLANSEEFIDQILIEFERLIQYRLKILTQINYQESEAALNNSFNKDLDKKEKLGYFLKRKDFLIELNSDIKFIITARFLKKYCIADNEGYPKAIDYTLIKLNFNIGSTPSKKVANYYQALLSKLSCNFILNLLNDYPINDGSHKNLHHLIREGERKRLATPYYNSTKILINNLTTSNLPIILSITIERNKKYEKLVFLFKRNPNTGNLILQRRIDIFNNEEPCIVFKGISLLDRDTGNHALTQYLKKLFTHNPITLILNNAATHPQFTGLIQNSYKAESHELTKQEILKQEPLAKIKEKMHQELAQMRANSEALGCSKDNPSLFFIKHIFCDLVKNEARDSLLWNDAGFHKVIFDPILPELSESVAV